MSLAALPAAGVLGLYFDTDLSGSSGTRRGRFPGCQEGIENAAAFPLFEFGFAAENVVTSAKRRTSEQESSFLPIIFLCFWRVVTD